MQILEPDSFDHLADWQFRVTEWWLGLISIVLAYNLLNRFVSHKAAEIGVFLLATNNYLIFMSRYMGRSIYLTPFALASIYFLFLYLKNKRVGLLDLSAFSLACAFLVKTSAAPTLVAIVLILALQRNFKKIIRFFSVITLFYTPVIIYNIGAYLTVGLMDTTFSRLFGLSNPNSTPVPTHPLVTNPPTFINLLIDQFSLPVFALFVFSLAFYFFGHHKNRFINFNSLWIFTTTAFFIATVIRAYYLVFIVFPLVFITSIILARLPKIVFTILLVPLLIYSFYYSFHTNISSTYALSYRYNDSGRSGVTLMPVDLTRTYSISARAWTEARGWKNLVTYLNSHIGTSCLTVDPNLDPLAVRRYLWTNDQVKTHFLGTNYPRRYPPCQLESRSQLYLTDHLLSQASPSAIIIDQATIPRFYLYNQPDNQ